jgi:glutathione S-transferase
MALTLYCHPLSSFCWKALIALYENQTPFRPHLVDLGDAKAASAFKAIWPIGKFPVLRDDAKDRTVPESTIIIEYLAQHYPGQARLIPADPGLALDARLADRVFDLYVHDPMPLAIGSARMQNATRTASSWRGSSSGPPST